jgi:hypothetical protein
VTVGGPIRVQKGIAGQSAELVLACNNNISAAAGGGVCRRVGDSSPSDFARLAVAGWFLGSPGRLPVRKTSGVSASKTRLGAPRRGGQPPARGGWGRSVDGVPDTAEAVGREIHVFG